MMEVWGALAIFIFCPLLGGLPLIAWITYALTGQQLSRIGTGNISVSAAFYHGGKVVGILAVVSEAVKGISAVFLARAFFPTEPAWELFALIALIMGRYWVGKGAGTTNVVWGVIAHDWAVALLVFLIGGISFTILREKEQGRIAVLILFPLITALLSAQDSGRIIAAIALSILLGWIYKKIPDDLDMPDTAAQPESQRVFRFFRGDKAIASLEQQLDPKKVGQKAATLAQLKQWGYPVPMGWVLPPGDDSEPLIKFLCPSLQTPLVVRSSAIGEDSEQASAAGQYETILNVTSKQELQQAIARCQAAYNNPTAVQYRRDRAVVDEAIAVLIQKQISGVFSGVAFSRDPITQGDAVVIEALPGDATRVVSGRITPEQYRVVVVETQNFASPKPQENFASPKPQENFSQIAGAGDVPQELIKQVALLARQLENRYHGIPQDIEWSYDGQTLWLLQSRPITTLLPIWTRKIAAEVIPGLIRPLTWSINCPLTCGVWGEIFTLVLGGDRGLNFNATATLHYSRAYFNASLLGQIFRQMGLPPESLEFLTRGAKFSKPPLSSTLRNVPGLLRLLGRELSLEQDFARDDKKHFAPVLSQLNRQPLAELSPSDLLERINFILEMLKRATYYSILAPLSAALRQAVLRVPDTKLDNSQTPEVASLRAIASLAAKTNQLLPELDLNFGFEQLATSSSGQQILQQFDQILERYGYLSEVGTDIAVPTWQEDPQPVRDLFMQFVATAQSLGVNKPHQQKPKKGLVQRRVDLKGQVTEVYSQLLAHLRWSFVALEQVWLHSGLLLESGDIFFLEFNEVQHLTSFDSVLTSQLAQLIKQRRSQLAQDSNLEPPLLVYGNTLPLSLAPRSASLIPLQLLQGIGASAGQITGSVKVLRNLQALPEVNRDTILVVPYTDSGWAALLARAGGLIAEVGGRLSHGAIVAREYGIPAVMDVHNATNLLQDGQRVRIDGQLGIVEIL